MARKKKVKSPIKNGISKSSYDPKFLYDCFVRLENCDFSKYSTAVKGRDLSNQSTDDKNVVSRGKSKALRNTSIKYNDIINEHNCDSVKKQYSMKKFKPNQKVLYSNRNIMQQKKGEVKFSETPEKVITNIITLAGGKSLRTRKEINYRERNSIGTPEVNRNISQVESKKIPIYRKEVVLSPKCRKRKGDLYDFIPEPEEDIDSDVSFKINIPAKKKKIDQVHVPEKIAHKRLNQRRINKNVNVPKYHDKIDRMMNKFTEKLKNKQGSNNSLQPNTVLNKQFRRKDLIESNKKSSESVFHSTMLPESQKIVLLDESIIVRGLEDHNLEINSRENNKTNEHARIPSTQNTSFDAGLVSSTDSSSFPSLGNISVISFANNNLDNLFGFADDIEDNKDDDTSLKQINILQNVTINGSSFSKHYMSTPKRFQEKKTWRFDTKVVNRNPHFLAVKKNSLPALSQEPVLDHTFDDRIDVVTKMVLIPNNNKSKRQQSILNYIEATKEYSDYQDHSQSLYDITELSPLKHEEVDKENSSEKRKLSNENRRSKRNILALLNENNVNSPSPTKNNEELGRQKTGTCDEQGKTSDKLINFGFDSTSEVIEDEHSNEQRARPFRIEFTYKKCNKNKIIPEILERPVRDSEVRRLIEEDPGFEEVVDKDGLDCGELGLFEDIEGSPKHTKSYKIFKKKKTDTDKNTAPKEKLTKEARKWIKQFNEMCDQVENEELEIE